MAAGDAQRVWFPKMIDELRAFWSEARGWVELADFCGHMTERRKEIRAEKGIRPPKIAPPLPPGVRCPGCGRVSKTAARPDPLGVSIRSALFALKNNEVISADEFKDLDKNWMKHKRKNKLDAYGLEVEMPDSEAAGSIAPHCH